MTATPAEHVAMAKNRDDWVWQFHRIMTKLDRERFDQWLVDTNHPLAYQPGTTERRFRLMVET